MAMISTRVLKFSRAATAFSEIYASKEEKSTKEGRIKGIQARNRKTKRAS
jgi:hypothetical protein